ncbi:hypothetical protein QBC33DRAFT_182447 [Phialemonium atrogriseum]|uniref:Uncharacterized protein n=1 Tax=Phialemonium atrogriseum TaxID=1093897 RepID=A0AAJ0BZ48_9PEZI|nr:uncharacterized protein QBC33DRAFT_182447 [Phialemonium atrogriseum]KAK1764751.1 hypothetical protein QBC33DRAFT_182447 [Phialemonium atrogriseum]
MVTDSVHSPVSPGVVSGAGVIPIALSPTPPLSSPPAAVPIAGSAQQEKAGFQSQGPQGRFREVGVDGRDLPPLPPMPFSPEDSSPTAVTEVKWSRVRELRASLKPSRRLPPPLPSPSVYDGFDGDAPDVEQAQSSKRKTLLQRAIEGWWDLPGLLSRSDTVRGKSKPFPSSRKETS